MVYKCRDCGHVFDKSDAIIEKEWIGNKEQGGFVNYMVCPNCKSYEVSDVIKCAKCGNFEYSTDAEDALCCGCQTEVMVRWKEFCRTFIAEEQNHLMSKI